uniref:Immunoglobulin subtype domain-containing protein n=1 Tax=Monopterus albus TaxID=43700 RepID=A0A3Q3JDN0_MONAL
MSNYRFQVTCPTLVWWYILNLFNVFPGCREDQIFETETVYVGDDVNLTCTRKGVGNLVWARLASGKAPQALGKSFSLKTVHPRITTSEESETFVLHITKARLSDTAFYFCINKQQQSSIFLKGTALRVEGKFKQTASIFSELDVTADPSPAPCHPGDSVTLQCSLLSDSENKTCSEENSVCCFRAGSHQSHQSFYHTHIFDEYKRNPEGFSRKKCVYSFFKNISSSDAGTCYCAVATCEEIFSGNGTKLDIEGNYGEICFIIFVLIFFVPFQYFSEVNTGDSQRDHTVLFILCVALAITLIVIAFLISSIKACDYYTGRGTLLMPSFIWGNLTSH